MNDQHLSRSTSLDLSRGSNTLSSLEDSIQKLLDHPRKVEVVGLLDSIKNKTFHDPLSHMLCHLDQFSWLSLAIISDSNNDKLRMFFHRQPQVEFYQSFALLVRDMVKEAQSIQICIQEVEKIKEQIETLTNQQQQSWALEVNITKKAIITAINTIPTTPSSPKTKKKNTHKNKDTEVIDLSKMPLQSLGDLFNAHVDNGNALKITASESSLAVRQQSNGKLSILEEPPQEPLLKTVCAFLNEDTANTIRLLLDGIAIADDDQVVLEQQHWPYYNTIDNILQMPLAISLSELVPVVDFLVTNKIKFKDKNGSTKPMDHVMDHVMLHLEKVAIWRADQKNGTGALMRNLTIAPADQITSFLTYVDNRIRAYQKFTQRMQTLAGKIPITIKAPQENENPLLSSLACLSQGIIDSFKDNLRTQVQAKKERLTTYLTKTMHLRKSLSIADWQYILKNINARASLDENSNPQSNGQIAQYVKEEQRILELLFDEKDIAREGHFYHGNQEVMEDLIATFGLGRLIFNFRSQNVMMGYIKEVLEDQKIVSKNRVSWFKRLGVFLKSGCWKKADENYDFAKHFPDEVFLDSKEKEKDKDKYKGEDGLVKKLLRLWRRLKQRLGRLFACRPKPKPHYQSDLSFEYDLKATPQAVADDSIALSQGGINTIPYAQDDRALVGHQLTDSKVSDRPPVCPSSKAPKSAVSTGRVKVTDETVMLSAPCSPVLSKKAGLRRFKTYSDLSLEHNVKIPRSRSNTFKIPRSRSNPLGLWKKATTKIKSSSSDHYLCAR